MKLFGLIMVLVVTFDALFMWLMFSIHPILGWMCVVAGVMQAVRVVRVVRGMRVRRPRYVQLALR